MPTVIGGHESWKYIDGFGHESKICTNSLKMDLFLYQSWNKQPMENSLRQLFTSNNFLCFQ